MHLFIQLDLFKTEILLFEGSVVIRITVSASEVEKERSRKLSTGHILATLKRYQNKLRIINAITIMLNIFMRSG